MDSNITYPVYSFRFWSSYIIQMRPYLLFVSGVAGAAGIAMAKHNQTPLWNMIIAFIPFFLGYGFGQALTDCFQTDTDKLSAPYRPLSKGTISVRSVLIVSISGLIGCGIILFFLSPISFFLSLAAVIGLATYSYIKKNFWFGGPFYNAWIVALLPLMGYFAIAKNSETFSNNNTPYIALTFFSYASFVLIGYLKDIEADKTTHYKTFAVVFGWTKTVLLGDVFTFIVLVLFWWPSNKNQYEIMIGMAASIIIITGQIFGHLSKIKDENDSVVPVTATVRSFVLFHLAVILHFQPQWWIFSILYYILFEVFLFLRPSRVQV